MNKKLVEIATQIMVMAVIVSVMLLFIGIGVLFLVHVCIVGRAFRRALGAAPRPSNDGARNGLSPEDLEKLPCYDFKVGAHEAAAECAVCLDIFQTGDRCRLLPACRHSFHAQCVDSWLMKSPLCPTCRTSASCTKADKAADGEGHRGAVMLDVPPAAAQRASLPALALAVTLDV